MARIGPNERCPCGSGKKLKKCCGDPRSALPYSAGDRASAFAKLDGYIQAFLEADQELASEEFWGRYFDRCHELSDELDAQSGTVEDMWYAFDRAGARGVPADQYLADAELTGGERAFLTALCRSSMHLYEVVDAVPGVSLTLRDAIEGGQVIVHERSGSRTLGRHDYLAARVVPRGKSGGPEMEAGPLHVPRLLKDAVIAQIREHRARFLDDHRGGDLEAFYKTLAPLFHDAWVGALLEPAVPELKTADGEDLIPTKVQFEVADAAALSRALDGRAELARAGEGWLWSGKDQHGAQITLGYLTQRGDRLILETESVERADRGRALVESIGGEVLRHRVTSHENLRRAVQDGLRASRLRGEHEVAARPTRDELPAGVGEALVLGYYARYYRTWIDEPVPALAGLTPRKAATDPKRRAGVIELVQGLLATYQAALRQRQPAYDPSWMWAELGLVDGEAARHPPPLAHERVAEDVPGSGELARAMAERVRRAPGFDDSTTTFSREAEAVDLEVQRFVRAGGAAAAPYVRLMVNVELHRRKTFWVDESLAYLLDQTELDVVGRELRVPFASFALVFTDRHTLSLAERMLATRDGCPLSGQLLRIATVYVGEQRRAGARSLEVCFALDALGADLPVLVRHEVPLADDAPVRAYLDAVAPVPQIDPPPPDTSPIRGLLRMTINAILYATSASVAPERRAAPERPARRSRAAVPVFSSDEVYFLPGTIDITKVRKLQELERAPDGGAMLRRHLVRGHWRRPVQTWVDLRLCWIAPYWKGPDLAGIIEHAYRLKR